MKKSHSLKIVSIVVTYNGLKWIKQCLDSLLNVNLDNHTIIVVDNRSTDGTDHFVQKNYPSVQFIRSEQNLGFGKANNIGLRIALEEKCDYAFLLNQDAWVEKSTLYNLINIHLQNPEYGIISPIHLNKDNKIDRNFSSFILEDNKSKFLRDSFLNKNLEPIYECDYVNAAAWLISRKCLLLNGGFMPVFSHYGEDNNYCQRVLHSGLKIGYTPGISIIHDRGERKRSYSLKNAYKRLYVEYLVIFTFPEKYHSLYLGNIIKEFQEFFIQNLQRPHKFILAPIVLFNILLNWNSINSERILSLRNSNNFLK